MHEQFVAKLKKIQEFQPDFSQAELEVQILEAREKISQSPTE